MSKRIVLLLFPILFLGFCNSSFAQKKEDKNAKIKAVFIYNFTKYIIWPEHSIDESFKIGIYDNNDLYEELLNMAEVKKVSNRKFEVVKLQKLSELDASFEAVFFNDKKKFRLKSIYSTIGNKPILAVTDSYEEDGVMIDFRVDVSNRQKFALNKVELENHGLKVDPILENIAILVKSEFSYYRKAATAENNASEKVKVEEKTASTEKNSSDYLEIAAPTISNEKYDAIIAQMQAELESDKEVIENQGQEISTLKSSISELETTILLKENELDFVKQQIESQSKKLSAISDSTILKAKELQANIQKSKEALGNLQSIQAELNESKAILESQKLINAVTIIVLIIIAILGAIAYKNYRTQKSQANIIREQMIMAENQRDEIQNQHLQLEEKSREITDSINYAKKIQEAILPPMRLVEKHLPDSFIFYLPKDIVAGDFYWMEQVSDQVIFAAADCTGHGVPGALVSVVCSNALNRAVREFQLTQPAEILDKTLEIVIERFARSEEEVKDGMDIALCSYNPKNMQLEYAGAHNPLWIIREGATEIEEIKGNKQPIGTYAEHTPFTNHNVQLNKGDSVYLFSDGYIDQFGGEKGKKLKSVNFKKILLSIQDKTIDQQHGQLQKSFAEWKEGIEQLDDVCVIGFRA